ncbi:hypothetical protein [Pseudomonas benzenivorans]|uniref:Uncharacterized protein n=1 Tax=Pseudomonas benzenivorans TaxID=556533 RepID=A0ABY5H4E3_9PSED|nr:hypothetical protein [Pseudomonas benzenivorans]UTW07170.1 hypothetical protein KDW96_18685 [Pseudomonas benzenivorans]
MKWLNRAYWLLALLLLAGCDAGQAPMQASAPEPVPSDPAAMTPLQRAEAGQALWEEKCRTLAGEKIYKTVADVEGLVLLKIRPQASDREWADPNWPGAAFAREARQDEYINSFLGYEEAFSFGGVPRTITKEYRGAINTSYSPGPKQYPGYRYVDVINPEDGQRYRYTGRWEEPWQYDKSYLQGYIKFFLDKTLAPEPSPRYGVTFEDHVIPADRALGVASSTVRIIDLKTNEVLGEMLRYAWSTPASRANPSPWLAAHKCPSHAEAASSATRMFVDQVLIPRKEQ